MRALQIVGSLVLGGVLAYVTAVIAQFADPSPVDGPVEEVGAIKQRVPEDWLVACVADWDEQTHMTKTEWRASCARVASERGYYQLSTASVTSVGDKAR